jgi:poly(3-hydroxybutyrate) depolymerase
VFIDPIGDMSCVAGRAIEFCYAAIEGVEADLMLVTHKHRMLSTCRTYPLASWRERGRMIYRTYAAGRALTAPIYVFASMSTIAGRFLPQRLASSAPGLAARALSETVSAARLTHERPHFGIDAVSVAGNVVAVREEPVQATPFGTLVHFAKELDERQPRVLVLPGLAGHFSILVRGTIRTLLPDHDVYIADWHNARDIPPNEGRFGFDEYIGHIIEFLETIGPGAHLMAVCQPCPAALAAAAIMADDGNPAQPQSLVLMAGPVDARITPGPVNVFAGRQSLRLLERTVIMTVPPPYRGAGRRVYPGFLQVAAFMSMNARRHISAFTGLFRDTLRGNEPAAQRTKDFYGLSSPSGGETDVAVPRNRLVRAGFVAG